MAGFVLVFEGEAGEVGGAEIRRQSVELADIFPSYLEHITIILPDDPALAALEEEEIRIDLACGAFAAGHLSRKSAADVAGVSRYEFDQALYARRIPSYTEEMLAQDLEAMAQFSKT